MKLPEVCVRRPVFTTMMIGALLVLGLYSFLGLGVDLWPDVDFPFVVVQTVYPGASAETVESEVTEKIEEAVNQISGVRHIQSRSQEGFSLLIIEFELEVEGINAAQDVREKVTGIRTNLPDDIEEPIVSRYDPDAESVISLAISGKRTPREITQLAKDKIKPRLEPVTGVGSVELIGQSEREIRIALNPDKMESYQVTVDDIRQAVSAANLEVPGGRVLEGSQEFMVRTLGRLERVSQFDSVIVKNHKGTPFYLADVARVVDTIVEQRSLARLDGLPALGMNIIKQSGANVVDMADNAKRVIAELQGELPPDIKIDIVDDNSLFIEESIHEILVNIFFGTLLAVIVIFLFLLDWRPTLITALAIPISIVATFTLIKFLGFTINMMSLLGLSLAVGILVDDAIVVIENIYRHLDEGKSPFDAAIWGTDQIGLAVIAATSTILVVFLPVAFMEGIIGRFFYQFGMTVAFAVAVSLLVAFTLTPMLASRMFDSAEKRNGGHRGAVYRFLNLWNRAFEGVKPHYRNALAWSLRHRFLVMLVATVSFVGAMYMVKLVGTEFMPEADQGKFAVSIKTPPGTELDVTSQRLTEAETVLRGFSEVEHLFTSIGGGSASVNEGRILVLLSAAADRVLSATQLKDSVRVLLAGIPGMKYAVGQTGHEGGGDKPIEISIRGDNSDELARLVHRVEAIARSVPGVTDIDNTLEEGKPEIVIDVDRKLADDLGLSVYSLSMTLRHLVEGDVVTRFKEDDEEYDVRVQLDEQFRSSEEDVGRVLVESRKEIPGLDVFLVPLGRVARLTKQTTVGEYMRYDRQREARVNANVLSGYFAGTSATAILTQAADIQLPPGYKIAAVGQQEIMEESFANILSALVLSIVFIYLVLASQYESFYDPISIMVSLPLSLVGAVLGLLVFGSSLSIVSMIGIVMLMGLVTKNAILLIDFVKQERANGVSRVEAILAAGPVRLRPILMTSLATVFGMLPLALGIGPGAEFRAGMARAVIGGVLSSTFLTLLVVPVVYTIVEDVTLWVFRRKRATQPSSGAELTSS